MTGQTARQAAPHDQWLPFVLVGSEGLWAADCLVPGCLWTCTTSTAEAADRQAIQHTASDHCLEGTGS